MLVQLLAREVLVEVLVIREIDLPDEVLAAGDDVLVNHDPLPRVEGGECAVRLILQAVPIREEENAVVLEDVAREQFPDELEDRERLPGARRHEKQNALLALREPV